MAKITIIVEDCVGEELVKVWIEYDPPIPGNVAAADLTCAQLLGLQLWYSAPEDHGAVMNKLCRDCTNCVLTRCHRPGAGIVELINGYHTYPLCEVEREFGCFLAHIIGRCGQEGRYYDFKGDHT